METLASALSPRERFEAVARKLARPILACAAHETGLRTMPVSPVASDRAAFAPLEALGRLLCGLAPWLEQRMTAPQPVDLAEIHAAQKLIVLSTGNGPGRLDFTQGTQPLVDSAFLAQAVLRAPTALWSGLDEKARTDLVDSLRETRTIKAFYNNWLLFAAMIEAMFCRVGCPWDRARIDYALRQHDAWYVGDGVYSDGQHFRMDFYNSFVIQPMLIDILDAVAGQYREWDNLAVKVRARAQRHAVVLERLIGSDGSFPPVGRSITYRCAAFQLLAQLALRSDLPPGLSPGQVRGALLAVIERTLGGPRNFDSEGWLAIGLSGAQPGLGEYYINTGSLYLCSTALLPLGLPADDRFWSAAPEPWTQRRIWLRGEDHPADVAFDKR